MSTYLDNLMTKPQQLLALSLSLPANNTVNLKLSNKVIRVEIPPGLFNPTSNGTVLGSKETIALAILLFEIWEERFKLVGPRGVGGFEYALNELASIIAKSINYNDEKLLSKNFLPHADFNTVYGTLRKQFNISYNLIEGAENKCNEIFMQLEEEGLIIDPVMTTSGLMILLGLVPVHWSVRTPKGEAVHKRIMIKAGLWDLELNKNSKQEISEWEFNFRGIRIIKRFFQTLAHDFIHEEIVQRESSGKPTMTPPKNITIDLAEEEHRRTGR